jgi:hypothetical protein
VPFARVLVEDQRKSRHILNSEGSLPTIGVVINQLQDFSVAAFTEVLESVIAELFAQQTMTQHHLEDADCAAPPRIICMTKSNFL